MRFKFVVILFIFLLSTQKIFATAATEPDYAENIQLFLNVDPYKMSCNTTVTFSFSGLSRPLNLNDFRSEPSFLGLSVIAQYSSSEGTTQVSIILDGSKIDKTRGRFIADKIAYKFEKAFEMPILSYNESLSFIHDGIISHFISSGPEVLDFTYFTEFPAVDLRNTFLDSLPFKGFRQVLTSILLNNHNYNMLINLGNEGGWSVELRFDGGAKKLVLDQEQIISLKEITGYSGNIDSASKASSTLSMNVVFDTPENFELMLNTVSPKQMQKSQETDGGLKQYNFGYDVTGSSIEDFSISLKIVSVGINILAIAIILIQITTALCSITFIFSHHRKKGGKAKPLFFQQQSA